jgi:PEP-CTERM motif-containing protein
MWRLVLAFAFIPAISSANLMTFDALDGPPGWNPVYVEDGITATGALGSFRGDAAGFVHVDRAGTANGSQIDFTMESAFVAESAMIRPSGSGYCAPGCTSWSDPIDYIWFSGFLEGSLVNSFGVYRPASPNFELFDLSIFGAIDRLRIEARTFVDLGLPGACTDASGCGHFDVDNVHLTPTSVPEPSTLLLLSGALAGLALARRRAA